MELLFISMSARTTSDNSGNIYLNAHMNRKTIQRCKVICDKLWVILRDNDICCTEEEARKKYDPFPKGLADSSTYRNPYHPITDLFSVKKHREMNRVFLENIKWAGKVAIASATGICAETGTKYCEAYNKRYMFLVDGFALGTNWNHGWDGKFAAWKHEYECKENMAIAPHGLYATKELLQKGCPCHGKTIGCSDVETMDLNPDVLKKRLEKTTSRKATVVLDTIVNVGGKRKGHKFVIEAISLLKRKSHKSRCHLSGAGGSVSLTVYAGQLGVKDQVVLDGIKPHLEVYMWFDDVDICIQPSFTERLCRAVVEAMNRACPVIYTDVGGNGKLCSKEFLVGARNIEVTTDVLEKLTVADTYEKQAKSSLNRTYDYYYEVLNGERNDFLKVFVEF